MKKRNIVRISAALIAFLLAAAFIFTAILTSGVSARVRGTSSAETSARGMCTVEVTSGRVLYEKNGGLRLPMASTTKIITAITVIENVADLDEQITVHPRSVGIEGTSIYLKRDEKLTVRELLFGLMLRSGNDAAAALALHVCPSKDGAKHSELFDAFSEKMNETARKAGATDSSFKNPHGLDQENHYTTARDLALISAYAMRNPTFAEIAATKSAKISGVDYPRLLNNKNRLLKSLNGCVGVKTGFTKKAGRCFVGARKANGMTVVCSVLNCGPMFEESEALMRRAADEYVLHRILTADEFIQCTAETEKLKDAAPEQISQPDGAELCDVISVDGDSDEVGARKPCKCTGIARESFFYPLRAGEKAEITLDEKNVCVRLNNDLIYCGEYNKIDC